jgi:hypothetical protein
MYYWEVLRTTAEAKSRCNGWIIRETCLYLSNHIWGFYLAAGLRSPRHRKAWYAMGLLAAAVTFTAHQKVPACTCQV